MNTYKSALRFTVILGVFTTVLWITRVSTIEESNGLLTIGPVILIMGWACIIGACLLYPKTEIVKKEIHDASEKDKEESSQVETEKATAEEN